MRNVLRIGVLLGLFFCAAYPLAQTQPGGGSKETPGAVKIDFVLIMPGTFQMGCVSDGCKLYRRYLSFDTTTPVHKVRLTKEFELGKYEVTQAQWQAVMRKNPSHFKGADRPVENVSWNDVQEFIQGLNERNDGYRYRLPTEAEWEHAARAGTTDPSPKDMKEVAWHEQNSGKKTHAVGKKKPNAWSLYDMRGNVSEWVDDLADVDEALWRPFGRDTTVIITDPKSRSTPRSFFVGGERKTLRVTCGGSWEDLDLFFVENCGEGDGETKSKSIGFRLVRERVQSVALAGFDLVPVLPGIQRVNIAE